MRYENFAPGEHYHLYGRGVNKQKLFLDKSDSARFLFLITHFQSPTRVYNIGKSSTSFIKKGVFGTTAARLLEILKHRSIELSAFAIMSNHFHLLIRNIDDSAASVYMHRILTAYGKYFNAKYKKVGHVFEGPFGAVHIANNSQLLHLSAYIHKNPADILEWTDSYEDYPYSSYQDYIRKNRFGKMLSTGLILDQYKDKNKYKNFVETSIAKEHLSFISNIAL